MIFLLFAIFTTCLGQFFYKFFYFKKKKISLFFAIFFFVLTPLLSYQALKILSIDVVYTATAINIILILMLSKFFLRETISKQQLFGSTIIIIGIILFNWN